MLGAALLWPLLACSVCCALQVHVLDKLPTTGSGKVQKTVLRQMLIPSTAPAAAAAAAAAIPAAAIPAAAGPLAPAPAPAPSGTALRTDSLADVPLGVSDAARCVAALLASGSGDGAVATPLAAVRGPWDVSAPEDARRAACVLARSAGAAVATQVLVVDSTLDLGQQVRGWGWVIACVRACVGMGACSRQGLHAAARFNWCSWTSIAKGDDGRHLSLYLWL